MQFEANACDSGERVCRLLASRMRTADPGSAPHPREEVLFLLSFSGYESHRLAWKRPGTDGRLRSGASEGLTG